MVEEENRKITISAIKADVGSIGGHTEVPEYLLDIAKDNLEKRGTDLIDHYVTNVGDDLDLILTHREGGDSEYIHELAWDTFQKAAEKAEEDKLYGAGQDLSKEAFSGNVKGMGPGVAEMEFTERRSDPVIFFGMDKTEAGAFNLPIYKTFADPFTTAGLVIDPNMHEGFKFRILDLKEDKEAEFSTPEENYDLLAFISHPSDYAIKKVYPKEGNKNPTNEPVVSISTERVYEVSGEYRGKDDPVALVRAQSGFPAAGEIIEPYAKAFSVKGWMRGSHHGSILPVSKQNAKCTRFDGPPRVVALGFQLKNGEIIGPQDYFDDPAFDGARRKANEIADYYREHGPFEPHKLPSKEMEYTSLPEVYEKLEDRFKET